MNWIAQYWIEAGFGILLTVMLAGAKRIFTKFKMIKAEQAAQGRGIQALLRDRIVQAYYHYESTKSITLHGLENVEAMYKEYSNLGGNGAVKKLVEDMRKFKVVESREIK